MIGIYRIYNVINGKSYVGQTKDLDRRWEEHKMMLMKGKHHSKKLQADFNRFGASCFVFVVLRVYLCYDKRQLDKDERMFIEMFNAYHRGYNQTRGNDHS